MYDIMYWGERVLLENIKGYLKPKNFVVMHQTSPGGRLNKKDGLSRYGDSHVKDMTS